MTQQPPDDDAMAAVRPYLQLASGILGMSAAKAAELAQGLWAQGGESVGDLVGQGVEAASGTADQVAALLSPDQVRAIVRDEVDRVVRKLGFAREDEVASLRREVVRLERQIATMRSERGEQSGTSTKSQDKSKPRSKSKGDKPKSKQHIDDDGGRS